MTIEEKKEHPPQALSHCGRSQVNQHPRGTPDILQVSSLFVLNLETLLRGAHEILIMRRLCEVKATTW